MKKAYYNLKREKTKQCGAISYELTLFARNLTEQETNDIYKEIELILEMRLLNIDEKKEDEND